MNHAEAAQRLSVLETEISDAIDSPAGAVIVTRDGVAYVDVPVDRPDAEGKTGLMFLAAPTANYGGNFPVYAQPGAVDTDDDVVLEITAIDPAEAAAAVAALLGAPAANTPPADPALPPHLQTATAEEAATAAAEAERVAAEEAAAAELAEAFDASLAADKQRSPRRRS